MTWLPPEERQAHPLALLLGRTTAWGALAWDPQVQRALSLGIPEEWLRANARIIGPHGVAACCHVLQAYGRLA